jgi:primosomal protein N' (replication factor Y) (superfamily II helicase)
LAAKTRAPAADQPVARVCVDVALPHLDRPFDYLVPADAADAAQPGVRVRVRFAGQLVDGYLLERVDASAHGGRLAYLERVVSPEPVLTPAVAALCREVADRYAGTLFDVLRLAVPPRHARAESAVLDAAPVEEIPLGHGWQPYGAGDAFLRHLRDGRRPRAVWTALPGEDWPTRFAEAAAACLAGGRGALFVVADARDLDRLDAALIAVLGRKDLHVALSAAVGPAERYRRFLAARRGAAKVVIGTRAAAFAPVHELGLVGIWDDGDDLHAEPRAPYPHARQVLLARAELAQCAALLGAYARSAEAQQLIEANWAHEVVADRETVRRVAPRVKTIGDGQLARDPGAASARLPSIAWQAAREALAEATPVLIQVPRRGYLPAVACAECHTPARCTTCSGPLGLPASSAPPACRWCGRPAAAYACPNCGGRRLRAAVTGARRTAEELARAFPGTPVRTSGRDGVLTDVPAEPALVVATPGAEPVAPGGYGAVLLLDTWALLTRADLRATEEALRRWLAAASLAATPRTGRVVVVADGSLAVVQALLRFDPGWLAARELAERRELGFPPAARVASLTGTPVAVAELLEAAELPPGAELLGPVPVADGQERMLVRTTRGAGKALAAALRAAAGVRSARKAPDPVRIQIDPLELL